MGDLRKAAFLDRDGVINIDSGYVFKWEDFVFTTGALDALRSLIEHDFTLVIVTNQSGIARGLYSEDDFHRLTNRMLAEMRKFGVDVAAVYKCPHYLHGVVPTYSIDCNCRKPKPGMILKALHELDINPDRSVMIGDKLSDKLAADAAGIRDFYFMSNLPVSDKSKVTFLGTPYATLKECVAQILSKDCL